MANETVARRYALAIFQLASDANKVETVGRDLNAVARAVGDDAATQTFFLSPVVDRKEKERVLLQTFSGKVDDVALHALLLLVRKRREALLREIVRQYAQLEMDARGAERLTVTSARDLSGEELHQLVSRLERLYGKKFDVTQRVDPKLIGGVRLTMGDRRIDGSVEGRLDELSRTLFAQT